jgi:hypothetical protein
VGDSLTANTISLWKREVISSVHTALGTGTTYCFLSSALSSGKAVENTKPYKAVLTPRLQEKLKCTFIKALDKPLEPVAESRGPCTDPTAPGHCGQKGRWVQRGYSSHGATVNPAVLGGEAYYKRTGRRARATKTGITGCIPRCLFSFGDYAFGEGGIIHTAKFENHGFEFCMNK